MNGALFFADLQTIPSVNGMSIETRDIHFVKTLDYDSIEEDDLGDLDLNRTTVLVAESESRLFLQMNRCYFLAAERRESMLEPNEFDQTIIRREVSRGDEIRNQLVLIFHKLTVSIAKNFVCPRHDLEELVSEGDATLLRSISLFDPSRGFRFSTYATYAIRRRLARYVNSSQHRHATPVDFRSAPPIVDRQRWGLAYEQAMEAGIEWLEVALYELSQRERYIIRCRFGWGREFEPRTLQQIADELGISRERVRQLEVRAIDKLREVAAKVDLAGL